ncbi:hypothetical protein Thiowin_02368 [Thiorhodovibrio winogradskyi]|uniref:Uncharacterized protein n=1 Tax=Thiorhodovibrio winogradskyi TaxID=77007 RepID=A0ABZ0S8M9_9GAMM|nr:hypothetical protein [Thiorhodovibrio winogradskyi]
MTAIQFKVPDQVEQAFNAVFADQDKDAIIADLMRQAIARAESQGQRHKAISRILDRRTRAPIRTEADIAAARREGRP